MTEKNKRLQELKARRKPMMPAPRVEKTKRGKIESLEKKHRNYFN